MTLQEVKEQMILKIPRLTKGKKSQETKYDYFGNMIEVGDVICRFFSAYPDVGVVISISDKGIEMTCERENKPSGRTKTGQSTSVKNSVNWDERDFSSALKQLAMHNSTKRVWCYSSTGHYANRCQTQIVNLTKLNLI
jgi:hypothetical protein